MSKHIKKYNDYIKEKYDIDSDKPFGDEYHIGDLVWAKNMGKRGLVGLVVSKPKEDDGSIVQDVYLRGYNGEVHPIELGDLEGVIDGGHLHTAEQNGDISAYTSIASKLGIELNSRYQEYIDEDSDDDESKIVENFNEQDNLEEYLKKMVNITNSKGGNGMNILELESVATHITSYLKTNKSFSVHPGEDGFYTDRTLNAFKELVDAMAQDDIENNNINDDEISISNIQESKKIGITSGQDKDIKKEFPDYDKEKSHIVSEGGNDNGDTFKGSFLVKIHKKGVYKFTDGKLDKKVK